VHSASSGGNGHQRVEPERRFELLTCTLRERSRRYGSPATPAGSLKQVTFGYEEAITQMRRAELGLRNSERRSGGRIRLARALRVDPAELGPGAYAQLPVRMGQVRFHGALRHEEPFGDFPVGKALFPNCTKDPVRRNPYIPQEVDAARTNFPATPGHRDSG
jgi:hypothetical protein